MLNLFEGKTILITGGTGYAGKEIAKYLLHHSSAKTLRIYSRDEFKQDEMRKEFGDDNRLRFFIGDVRDKSRMSEAFKDVNVVIHAAALKQVPSCEYNPFEAVKTNILGAENVIRSAIECGVEKVISLSTDKAVNPINLYGATKLVAEKLFIAANGGGNKTTFTVVRYGNVIGSRGSVIPLWIKQAKEHKPLTVTDLTMTRFWLSIESAVDLIIEAILYGKGGEIFVPKIKSAIMSNVVSAINIKYGNDRYEVMGVRPGEKMDEALIGTKEVKRTIDCIRYYVINPEFNFSGNKMWEGKILDLKGSYNSYDCDKMTIEEIINELVLFI